MEILSQIPNFGSFVPISEHQSTTPVSFFSGPPVLHYYSDRCQIIVREEDLNNTSALATLFAKCEPSSNSRPESEAQTNGTSSHNKTIDDIDVWVTSDKLLISSKSHDVGLSIPYPTICLHAIQNSSGTTSDEPTSQSLYMQLIPTIESNPTEDEPPDTISITIIPTASAPPPSTIATTNTDDAIASEDKPEQTPAQAMFTALSNCSNLHPDPVDDEDEEMDMGSRLMHAGLALPGTNDGSLPPPMPGSGGWITAENMHEFVDEEGNWIGGEDEDGEEQLGPGAGVVRERDHSEADGEDHSETKWQRTS